MKNILFALILFTTGCEAYAQTSAAAFDNGVKVKTVNTAGTQTAAGVKTWSNNAIFNGTLGLGVTASSKFEINDSGGNNTVFIRGFSANADGNYLNIAKSRNASIGSHTIVQNSDELGGIAFRGSDGTNYIQAASINALSDATPGTNDMPGRLEFKTTDDGSATPTVRMTIKRDGIVDFTNAIRFPNGGNNSLSHYETGTTSTSFTFNGGGGTSASVTVTHTRIGNVTTYRVQQALATTGTSSTTYCSNTAIPANFRPSTNCINALVFIKDNNTTQTAAGGVEVSSNGLFCIYKTPALTAWTNSAANSGHTEPFSFQCFN